MDPIPLMDDSSSSSSDSSFTVGQEVEVLQPDGSYAKGTVTEVTDDLIKVTGDFGEKTVPIADNDSILPVYNVGDEVEVLQPDGSSKRGLGSRP